ncbi:MAG: elongation factor Ts [Candidatus Omnitrophota bacterium]
MSLTEIKKLREMTSLGINDCKKALEETKGDFTKALDILRVKGVKMSEQKKDRKTSQGLIESYIHFGGNLGALVEVNCETDFVARTDVFKKFVKDIAMHVAAINPVYVQRQDIPEAQLRGIENTEEYFKEHCLMDQPYVKDNTITVAEYLRQVISQTGENIIVRRFSRFALEG